VPLTPATRLGAYEIIAPLGAGGMGEVYRARDTKLGREVALKVLPAEVSADTDRLARFEREARTVAGLNHPNIVVLHSMEQEGGIHFLTMELVDGQSLDQHVTAAGLPVARVLDLGIALADGLSAAHERGVIHRDLKPANVILSRDGRVKVLDFGLAKLAQNPSSELSRAATIAAPISQVGEVVGTVPYMAPEQLRGESVDARSDLFALGIMLYELAAGRRPFTGATAADVSSAILRDDQAPLTRVRADLPADLERIVSRCLEKDPRGRFQTALDVSNELRALRRALEHRDAGVGERHGSGKVASIAVLPFVNRSANADDEYFSDGLADELLGMLAKIRGLRVAARTSSFRFKGKDATIAEVGSTLHVATVLEGSVRKAGNRVRISVQLVKVEDGYHLWSETYDRTLDDIFAVQDDIAQSVVKELRTALLGEEADSDASGQARAEVSRAAKGRSTDPEAHRLYLMARHFLDRETPEETDKAIEYLKKALERDSKLALALMDLGRAYERRADRGWGPTAEGYRQAREVLQRALELEPDLAEAHANVAWIQMTHDWNWRGAEASFARALELAPENSVVLRRAGVLAWRQGRWEEGLELHQRALEADPLSAHAYSNLGEQLLDVDRFAEAEAASRRALELIPRKPAAGAYLSLALVAQGRGEEALAEAEREPEERLRLLALAIIHHALGHASESDAALRSLIEQHGDAAPFQVAESFGARGEVDSAFEWLERAYQQRDAGLAEMKLNARFRTLHGDPRWAAFLRRMGFEE
jgi:eukaryotic-like serine/threonine-protein kinase